MSGPTLVCALDLRASGADAARVAAALAKSMRGTLLLVHAHDVPELGLGLAKSVSAAAATLRERADASRRHALEVLREQERICGEVVKTESRLLRGRPVDAILTVAEEVDAAMIVLGRHERAGSWASRAGDQLFGTTAQRIARHAKRPVLIVTGDLERTMARPPDQWKALVGHDFAAGGEAALAAVRGLTGAGTPIVLARVLDHLLSPEDPIVSIDEWAQVLRQELHGIAKTVPNPVESVVAEGSAGPMLAKLADKHEVDLLVVGAHAGSALTRVLLGSVAEGAIRHAHVPVLVVPPAEAHP